MAQLNFTPEIEVFYMLFERTPSILSMTSLKQHMEYFNFRCKIQLDHPVKLICNLQLDIRFPLQEDEEVSLPMSANSVLSLGERVCGCVERRAAFAITPIVLFAIEYGNEVARSRS